MCGIFGYAGKKNGVSIALEGLKHLEYRGYDSAGFAGSFKNELVFEKTTGKISLLKEEAKKRELFLPVVIAHTRWATHGRPSDINAHPQFDEKKSVAVVHNGIIENFESLKKQLKEKNVPFVSDTDTEIIPHLIADFYEGDLFEAVQKTVSLLEGTFAIAVIHKDFPDQILVSAHQATLAIGIGENESFVSSDPHAFSEWTKDVIYLSDKEIAIVTKEKQKVFDHLGKSITKKIRHIQVQEDAASLSKGNYSHFTLKEIHQQPTAIHNAMASRLDFTYGTAHFPELNVDALQLSDVEQILILACGTSYHAGLVASYFFEEKVRIPVQVDIASEFRYKHPIILPNTLAIVISQSGETADTLAAMREVKAKGVKTLAICNVSHSTLAREADASLMIKAGPEIAVASTKAFTNQLVVIYLFGLMMGRMRHIRKEEGQIFLEHLMALSDQVDEIIQQEEEIQKTAKSCAKFTDFFFIGRSYLYPASLEGALKLKEISYVNANGYPAGELKHGPIALIHENSLTVALSANEALEEKMLSNIREIKARKGAVFTIFFADQKRFSFSDFKFIIPSTTDSLAPFLVNVVCQLFSYYIALEKGTEIDQPRNLAKSVTVE